MDRAEHLQWARRRALEYLEAGDLQSAFTSMVSDLGKSDELRGHPGIQLGARQYLAGELSSADQLRAWIEGFH